MNAAQTLDRTLDHAAELTAALNERTKHYADDKLYGTRHVANDATSPMQSGLDALHAALPEQVSVLAADISAQAQTLTDKGVEMVRQASDALRQRAKEVGDQTAGFVRNEPVKAVVMAAAAGAVTAVLVSWLNRLNTHRA